MQLIPLGTNGFIPTHGRQTMSFLLVHGDAVIVLDAGTGLSRLFDPAIRARLPSIETADELTVVLSHYHLDHVVGLSYLPAVWGEGRVRIHAPGVPLVDAEPREDLERLLSPPLFPLSLEEFPAAIEIAPYTGEELEIAGLEVRCRRQEHAGGSAGLVFGDRLAYLTDCRVDEGSADFVSGVQLLVHEVWVSEAEAEAGMSRSGHSTVEEVATLAAEAGVGALVPVHHHPSRTLADLEAQVDRLRSLSGVEVLLPIEGSVFEI